MNYYELTIGKHVVKETLISIIYIFICKYDATLKPLKLLTALPIFTHVKILLFCFPML